VVKCYIEINGVSIITDQTMKTLIFVIFLMFCGIKLYSQTPDEDAQDFVDGLILRMTPKEKISQLHADGAPQITRLGIPAYNWHNECLHGVVYHNATVFPQSIALAATFNNKLMRKVADAISSEARILYQQGKIGINFWSPNINIFRDPRWGRGQETYGEDPFLTGQMGKEFIIGLQGIDPFYIKAIATPKHFCVHSGPEKIRHEFNATVSQADLWETYLPAFKTAIIDAKAYSVLSSYNSVNGTPPTAGKWFLTDLLRDEWGFSGYVVSDCGAVSDVIWGHHFASSSEEAAAVSLKAGCDLNCGTFYIDNLLAAFDDGLIDENDLDTAVSRLMMARYKLGHFTNDSPYLNYSDTLLEGEIHQELAIEAARQSIILLKNENDILPFDKKIEKILVVGALANDWWDHRGGYSGWPSHNKNVIDALKDRFPDAQVDHERGNELVGSLVEVLDSKYVSTPDGEPGFLGSYFNNMFLEGEPHLIKVDPEINFDWVYQKPNEETKRDTFSVRWQGILKVEHSGQYTFRIVSDEGTRLFINDSLILDDWMVHYALPRLAFYDFEAGQEYNIVLEYFDENYFASCKLEMGYYGSGEKQLSELKQKATEYDAVIYVGGNSPQYEGEENGVIAPGFDNGDRTEIKLNPAQEKLVRALHESGTPLATVIVGGSMISSDWLHDNADAVIHSFYGGQGIAYALIDVLFGDFNPSGHLPLTFYRDLEVIPEFTDYNMEGRTYRYYDGEVLYPFGYGLSYSEFEFMNFYAEKFKYEVGVDTEILLTYTVSNLSEIEGSDVAQVYVRQLEGSNRAILELKGYKRFTLAANGTDEYDLSLQLNDLTCYNHKYTEMLVEPGLYEICLAHDSRNIELKDTILVINPNVSVDTLIEDRKVFPNPGNSEINLQFEFDYREQKPQVGVFDYFGREIQLVDKVGYFKNLIKVDISSLPTGMYFINITYQEKISRQKFIINR
jgi:beta-glucosidase